MTSKLSELGTASHLGHAIGPRRVTAIGEHRPDLCLFDDLGDHRRISGDDELVGETVLQHTLNHPGDEWLAGQKLKRFVGESCRA